MERLTEKVYGYTQLKACGNDFCKETCENYDEERSCNHCPIQKAIEKLSEYEDLEEQGLLIRLPCPIGTKVFYVQKCQAPSCKTCLGFTRVNNCYCEYKSRIFEQEFHYRHLQAFGKTVFRTKAEAEEALRKMNETEGAIWRD